MKRTIILTIASCCLLLTACNSSSIGIIGGTDGPTSIYVKSNDETVKGQFGEQYEKKSIRMFNVDGDLYFDSGLVSNKIPRCGTPDGELKNSVGEMEIPHKSGEANFEIDGYQNATSITKEANIDGKWVIFKKYGELPEDFESYKYCFYIRGHLNNAAVDSEIVVLTDNKDITFDDVYAPLLGSVMQDQYVLASHTTITSGDKWGITLYSDNVSKDGMTIRIEQFGGNYTGKLQIGQWFKIEKNVNDTWQEIKANPLFDYACWNGESYDIKTNDITDFKVEWEQLYGELAPGYYRLSKTVTDFKNNNDYTEDIYRVDFNIE